MPNCKTIKSLTSSNETLHRFGLMHLPRLSRTKPGLEYGLIQICSIDNSFIDSLAQTPREVALGMCRVVLETSRRTAIIIFNYYLYSIWIIQNFLKTISYWTRCIPSLYLHHYSLGTDSSQFSPPFSHSFIIVKVPIHHFHSKANNLVSPFEKQRMWMSFVTKICTVFVAFSKTNALTGSIKYWGAF